MKLALPWRRHDEAEATEPAEPVYSPENLPPLLDDVRTYVAHGDNVWGNSIGYSVRGDNEVSVHGWLSRAPFPRTGDKLLTKMATGKWGIYIFGNVKPAYDPPDMFTAEAFGAIGYAEDEPQSKRCDEFIEDLSPYLR